MDKRLHINSKDSVLLIVDVQDRLAEVMEEREMVIKNINVLVETARTLGMEILVTEQYPKGLGKTVEEIRLNRDSDYVEEKLVFSAYTENIREKLKALQKKTVLIVGMETHICVFQTVRDLSDAGYYPIVPQDAVCSRTKENKQNGLQLMSLAGGLISNTETILYDLLKEAGTPEFKVLSKLIK